MRRAATAARIAITIVLTAWDLVSDAIATAMLHLVAALLTTVLLLLMAYASITIVLVVTSRW